MVLGMEACIYVVQEGTPEGQAGAARMLGLNMLEASRGIQGGFTMQAN